MDMTVTDPHEGMWTHTEPKRASDLVIVADDAVLLIRRQWPPFRGQWALPGGNVDEGESHLAAAVRELAEETGLTLPAEALVEVGTYAAPGRDPRGPMTSVAYQVCLEDQPDATAGDDAAAVSWVKLADLDDLDLAFDHAQIIADALTAS
jgi:8-oxo-dGTP diphosphatase